MQETSNYMEAERKVQKIVDRYYRDGKFDRMIYPFELNANYERDQYLKNEFKQELSIILLTYKNKEKLVEMYEKKQLDFFILRIISNQLKSVNSPFWKTHNRWENNREMFKSVENIESE